MSIMDSRCTDGILYLQPKGRIDSANAQAAEEEITAAIARPHAGLVVDADELQYISSAGLRVILRLRKKEKDMKIVNASPEVYDIFEMTGQQLRRRLSYKSDTQGKDHALKRHLLRGGNAIHDPLGRLRPTAITIDLLHVDVIQIGNVMDEFLTIVVIDGLRAQ